MAQAKKIKILFLVTILRLTKSVYATETITTGLSPI